MRIPWLEQYFPRLRNAFYDITSPDTDEYNCIAHAAEDPTQRWWPGLPDYYWPQSASDDSVETFVAVFCGCLGYEVCENGDFEPGFIKVAIYAEGDQTKHMARQ